MSKKDLNKIAAIEKAIAEKYGEDAVSNPRSNWGDEKEKEYLEQLSETEKIALKIAHQQLESSFCIEKSIGFLSYLEKVNNK